MKLIKSVNLYLSFLISYSFLLGQDFTAKIFIPEPALELEISRSLGVPPRQITRGDIAVKLKYLEINDAKITSLQGLEHAENLEVLVLKNNLISDLSPISRLPNLRKLDLTNNRITSLGSLTDKNQSIDSLKEINLSDNKLKGLVGISKLSSLRTLDVSRNNLIDLEGVSELKSLISLFSG